MTCFSTGYISRPMPTTAKPEHAISATPRVIGARLVLPSANAWISDVPNMAVIVWTMNRIPTALATPAWTADPSCWASGLWWCSWWSWRALPIASGAVRERVSNGVGLEFGQSPVRRTCRSSHRLRQSTAASGRVVLTRAAAIVVAPRTIRTLAEATSMKVAHVRGAGSARA